ncbi:hypothetical protein [Pedobacter aquatilis]|uniref:hypothetical protein n=1 Tax=Pedobacter aquatilis TaxID=351343 RepID=UPI00292F85AF|nr:hypothetical protein [Pedobacter aquatilis]
MATPVNWGEGAPRSQWREDIQIDGIVRRCQKIDRMKLRLERLQFVAGYCFDKGEINYSWQGNELVKVSDKLINDRETVRCEYYFSAGQLIYAIQEFNPVQPSVELRQVKRFYAQEGKPVRQTLNGEIIRLDESFDEILRIAETLHKARNARDFNKVYCPLL